MSGSYLVPCDNCNGSGNTSIGHRYRPDLVKRQPCHICDGTGWIYRPPGTEDAK